jgi:hypothetical protein
MGVIITIPPNPLSTQIRTSMSPVLNGTEAHGTRHGHSTQHQQMRAQKINAQYVSTLQENCSHRIRRKTVTPEATFFVFLFHSSCFYPFTTNVTRALPLEAIKGEAGATSKGGDQAATDRVHLNRNHTSRFHAPPLTRDLGSAPSLKSL